MVGIDISDRSIKVAEVSGRDTPILKTVCWSPLAPNAIRKGVIQDVELVSASLKEALVQCSPVPIEGEIVVASIPETQSFVRVIDLPKMPDYEMDEAVQWAIRQHIPFDLERVYLDWQSLRDDSFEDAGRQQILVGAAQKDVVDPLLAVLDSSGLNVAALELESQAVVRSLLPVDTSGVNGILIVDLGATTTNVVFYDQGTMRFTTSIQSGGDDLTRKLAHDLQIKPSEAAEKKASVGVSMNAEDKLVSETLRDATKTLIEKVNRVVREIIVQSQDGPMVKAILLSGGSANLDGITEVFAEVFPDVPVQHGNPWTNIYVEEKKQGSMVSNIDSSHFVTALGLALRKINYVA